MMEQLNQNRIIDIYFNNSYKKSMSNTFSHLIFYLMRSFFLSIIALVESFFIQTKSQLYKLFLLIILAYNILYFIIYAYYYYTYVKNHLKIIALAIEVNHTLLLDDIKISNDLDKNIESEHAYERRGRSQGGRPQGQEYELDLTTQMMVSKRMYDFQNNERPEDVVQQYKIIREGNGESLITLGLQKQCLLYRTLNIPMSILSMAIFILGTIISFTEDITEGEHTVLELYLISEVLFRIMLYSILVLVALSPLICIALCVYMCCCKRQKKAKLPKKINATAENVEKCSQCSICYQGIAINDQIIVLPCSPQHIYHQWCIEGWTKVKPNCPICRHQLV